MIQGCVVIVFAKAPTPGRVKTRLAAAIGEEAAASLAARMLDETLKQAVASGLGPVELCCDPDSAHPAFQQARERHGVVLTRQSQGDLGLRMKVALDCALHSYRCALLIGTDCPQLDAGHLRAAADMLSERPAAFIPTLDGGYVLVGLSAMIPEIFEGIDWSTERVMRQTQSQLDRLGRIAGMLAPLADVDEPKDLGLVPEEWLEGSGMPANRTTHPDSGIDR
jgi:hypothetical protein